MRGAVLLLGLGFWSAVAAGQGASPIIHPWTRSAVANGINLTVDDILRGARSVFDPSAIGGEAVTSETLARARLGMLAAARAVILSVVYRLDLNGDGFIDQAELGQRAMFPLSADLLNDLRQADRNDDSRLDISEILALAERLIIERPGPFLRDMDLDRPLVPLALDRDGDGRVTREEFETAIREAFAAFDTDGDGRLSRTEIMAARAGGVR